MARYLLTVHEQIGTRYESVNRVIVKATDPGYAKYHWHKLMNQQGHMKDGEHEYVNHDIGLRTELYEVRRLDETEDESLIEELDSIPGFAEL